MREGSGLYWRDGHFTDPDLVLFFRDEVPGGGGILSFDDYGNQCHSLSHPAPLAALHHQAQVYQQGKEGLGTIEERR